VHDRITSEPTAKAIIRQVDIRENVKRDMKQKTRKDAMVNGTDAQIDMFGRERSLWMK